MTSNYMPGDPRLIDQIVYELKSQGIFDQFRKECIADVDTKPAYQNLRQRVEGSVTSFLHKQRFREDMNKNQLREQLRKSISESGFLETGVERIVDQVVNPKINTVFLPKVEDVVYHYLGLEKPNREYKKEMKLEVEDLLPTDLEAVSPESVQENYLNSTSDKKEECMETNENSLNSSNTKTEEDESPPFELIEESTNFSVQEENSVDSHLSSISGLASHDLSHSSDRKVLNQVDVSQETSQNSCESRLSIISSDEKTKIEVCEDISGSENSNKEKELYNEIENELQKSQEEKEYKEEPVNTLHNKSEEKKTNDVDYRKVDEVKKSDDKKSSDSKEISKKSHEKYKSSKTDKDRDKDRKDEKDKKSSKVKDSKDYKSSSKYSSSSKDKDKKDSRNGKDRDDKEKEKERVERPKDRDKSKESSRSKDSKDRHDKDKHDREKSKSSSNSSSSKHSKEKSSSSTKKDSVSKDKEKSDSRHSFSKDKTLSSKEKDASSKHRESSTKDKDTSKSLKVRDKKSSSSSSNKEKEKDKEKKSSGETKSKYSDKHKKSSDKEKSHDKKSSSSKKDKEKKVVDDHYSSKDKKNERRSTDRDSNDGSNKMSRNSSFAESNSQSYKSSSKESSEVFSSGSGESSNSDKIEGKSMECNKAGDGSEVAKIGAPQTIKYIKPKFASNIHEAMKIMKIRKQLAKLERQNQLALTHVETVKADFKVEKEINDDAKSENPSKQAVEKNEAKQASVAVNLYKPKENIQIPSLHSTDLSMENFQALEARLAQEMSTVNCNVYGEEDDNVEYHSIVISPLKKRKCEVDTELETQKILFHNCKQKEVDKVAMESIGSEVTLLENPEKVLAENDCDKYVEIIADEEQITQEIVGIESLSSEVVLEESMIEEITIEKVGSDRIKDLKDISEEIVNKEMEFTLNIGTLNKEVWHINEHVQEKIENERKVDKPLVKYPINEVNIQDKDCCHVENKHFEEKRESMCKSSAQPPIVFVQNINENKIEKHRIVEKISTRLLKGEVNEVKINEKDSYSKNIHRNEKHCNEEDISDSSTSLQVNTVDTKKNTSYLLQYLRANKKHRSEEKIHVNMANPLISKERIHEPLPNPLISKVDIKDVDNTFLEKENSVSERNKNLSPKESIYEARDKSKEDQNKSGKILFIKIDKMDITLTSKVSVGVEDKTQEKFCNNEDSMHYKKNEAICDDNIKKKAAEKLLSPKFYKNGCIGAKKNDSTKWADEDSPCLYFEKPNQKSEKHIEVLNEIIGRLEKAIEVQSLKIQNNIPKIKKVGRKRKLVETKNNNKLDCLEEKRVKKKHRKDSDAKTNQKKLNLCNNTAFTLIVDVSPNQSFSLPLSPAESDKSGEHKKEEPVTVKTKRGYGRASLGSNNKKRYSSDDLYKPRPVFNFTSLRRRGARIEKP